MKQRLIFVLFALANIGLPAVGFACEIEAKALLTEPSELYLSQKHSLMFQQYLDCTSPDLGLGVIIHEATHMEDVGAPIFQNVDELKEWFDNPSNIKFSIFTIDMKPIGELLLSEFPTPNELVNRFLAENYSQILADESHSIHSLLDGYINDLDTFAASSFSKGITELNAYTHGLRVEYRTSKQTGQRYGVLGFMFFLKAYLFQLQKEHPEKFIQLKSAHNTLHFDTLIEQTARVLEYTDHCQTMNEIEKRDFFSLLADPSYLDGLSKVAINSDALDKILCR